MKKILPLCFYLFTACKFREQADLIVYNANIYTVDNAFSKATAMVIRNGKIVETGSTETILQHYQSQEMVNADGKTIFPGFIDAHCHFTGLATDKWKCDLTETTSFEEVIKKIINYSKTAPRYWIYGRGWDQNKWPDKSFPDKKILDSLFPNQPVILKRIDGHAALVNQKALSLANITAATQIAGGEIEKINGRLTGMLLDNAMDIVDNIIPPLEDALSIQYYLEVQDSCFKLGLTGVHDCGISEHTLHLLDKAQQSGKLKMKVYALLSDSAQYYDKWIKNGPYKTPLLTLGGFKLYADGALGSRGACLLHGYSDKPDWTGFLLRDSGYYKQVIQKVIHSKFQLCTHAIGDSANRLILQLYASALKGVNNRRWRIEHAQVVNTSDFHYFKDYNIIPSVQPTHATSDMQWAEQRIGSIRLNSAYAYQQLWQTNRWMPLGTDFPVEAINPLKTFYTAVFRKNESGMPAGGFQLNNALTKQQAIKGMTIDAAKAAFEEKEKGSLEKGKAADFIVVDNDLITCPPEKVLSTKVLSTYSNGKRVF